MKYSVVMTNIMGTVLEENTFENLDAAQAYFDYAELNSSLDFDLLKLLKYSPPKERSVITLKFNNKAYSS